MIDQTMGIGYQARAVAAYLSAHDGVESSWDDTRKVYRSQVSMAPWYNGRERGLVFVLSDNTYQVRQYLVVAVFEHRNSDAICTVEWTSDSGFLNPPTLVDIPEGTYEGKYDTSFSVSCGQAAEMANHIMQAFEAFCKTWPTVEAA